MRTKSLFILAPLLILALMEGAAWLVYKSSKESGADSDSVQKEAGVSENASAQRQVVSEQKDSEKVGTIAPPQNSLFEPALNNTDPSSFPPPSVEEKNGKMERTIHIGVRQFVWEPATITAKEGELVRLIVHNADVKHGLVIPQLGVNQDIPPEGAVVEFTASKKGTFEFFCSVWCGAGHMEMRGKIVIE